MQYAKAGMAVIAAGASALVAAYTGDQIITTLEWINVAIAVATAAAVFAAPNVPGAPVTKFILAMIMTGLTAAVNIIAADPHSGTVWFQLLAAVAGAAAVYSVRNTPERPPTAV